MFQMASNSDPGQKSWNEKSKESPNDDNPKGKPLTALVEEACAIEYARLLRKIPTGKKRVRFEENLTQDA